MTLSGSVLEGSYSFLSLIENSHYHRTQSLARKVSGIRLSGCAFKRTRARLGLQAVGCVSLLFGFCRGQRCCIRGVGSHSGCYPREDYENVILILYTSLGYPCALLEFRRWKQSLTLNEQHCAATGNAEYQLVKQSSVTNESALKKGEKERARDFSSQSIVGYK
jgi:hypothetical protein